MREEEKDGKVLRSLLVFVLRKKREKNFNARMLKYEEMKLLL
jgi:hypothetical protein